MGTISLYLRDDVLEALDARVKEAAERDRADGLSGRQVASRSKMLEGMIEAALNDVAAEGTDIAPFAHNDIERNFGSLVFDTRVMEKRLPPETFEAIVRTMREGIPLDPQVADVVAHAMKEWAIEKGATHYTHWFQPLSGTTSEKHDAFLEPAGNGGAISKFSGRELVSGESDASSFPNGGLRSTFEARGYTAWDPTSFAFIKDEVLCIPTAFCSYNGEALDKKTPLLRSMGAISDQTKRVMELFGTPAKSVTVCMGAEQEFFLIPASDFAAREDLVFTGRTLFGYPPCKGQELEEHYYGAIRPAVNNFLKELDDELWALGIAAKTKHNEVAPSQHELAPVFTTLNRAVDENLLTMEKMTLLASRYNLACLLHEKPFEGINGSGKHNNWSIVADGKNLIDPGENPTENLRFLVFLAAIIEAVDTYQELIRMTVATAGNDHRLGANEAPPAIVSVFLGDELTDIVESLVSGEQHETAERVSMDLGVDVLPNFLKDNTDRNRTSPFAFTGNKFEFRMPGSNVNLADANMVLNTAIAKSLKDFADAMEAAATRADKAAGRFTGEDFEREAIAYVRSMLRDHKRIIFNGNGYAEEWEEEAAARGLAHNRTTAEALPCLIAPESIALFEEMGVLNEAEIRSRYEVKLEKYNKLINIEARVMKRMVRRAYLPGINAYAGRVAADINAYKMALAGAEDSSQEGLLVKLLNGVREATDCLYALHDAHLYSLEIDDQQARADYNAAKVIPAMEDLRAAIDRLEIFTSRDYWPVPSYNNMLFYV